MFTKEHYIKIAKILKDGEHFKRRVFPLYVLSRNTRSKIVQDFICMLESDNKKFDVEKFLDIIYGKEEMNDKEK